MLTLSVQSSPQQSIIYLRDISNIERIDLKPYCLLLETRDKRYHLAMKNDEELYGWQDDVYSRSPLMGVSNPTNFVHKVHVGFDPVSGAFTVRTVFRLASFSLTTSSPTGHAGTMEQITHQIGHHSRRLR